MEFLALYFFEVNILRSLKDGVFLVVFFWRDLDLQYIRKCLCKISSLRAFFVYSFSLRISTTLFPSLSFSYSGAFSATVSVVLMMTALVGVVSVVGVVPAPVASSLRMFSTS